MGKLAVNDNDKPWETAPRPGTLPKWTPPSIGQVKSWVENLGHGGDPFLTVTGPNPMLREEIFKVCYQVDDLEIVGSSRNTQDWIQKGVLDDLTQRIRAITGRPWGLLWDLLNVKDFVVEEPLRGLIDQGFNFTGFYKALWETRFLLQEGRKLESMALLGALLRWLCAQDLSPEQQGLLETIPIERPLGSIQERLDMLLFLLALGYQNGLADRTIFVLDGLNRVVRMGPERRKDLLRQLSETTIAFSRWSKLGSATGLVFGLDTTGGTLEALLQYNERLGKLVASSLV